MKNTNFYRRGNLEFFPEIITSETLENIKIQNRIYRIAGRIGLSGKIPDYITDQIAYPELPDGISRCDAGKQVSDELKNSMAMYAVKGLFNDQFLDSYFQKIKKIFTEDKRLSGISIIYPVRESNEIQSVNIIPAAISSYVFEKGREFGLPINIDLIQSENPLHIAIKRPRGIKSGRNNEMCFAESKLANQIVVAGDVKKDTLYIFVDDCVSLGGTIMSYNGYINDNNGINGPSLMFYTKTYGAEILKPNESSLKALKSLIGNDRKRLEGLMAGFGININFSDTNKCTATNQELLLMAAVFADPNNSYHRNLINDAMMEVGSSIEKAKISYITQAFLEPKKSFLQFTRNIESVCGIEVEPASGLNMAVN